MPSFETSRLMGPIPGQSLTSELGSKPWEQPPQLIHPEEVLNYYVDTLTVPKNATRLFTILERGYPVDTLVDSMLLTGTMQGLHTLDTGVLVAPALHKFIIGLAEEAEVDVTTGLEDDTTRPNATTLTRAIQESHTEDRMNDMQSRQNEEARVFSQNLLDAEQRGLSENTDLVNLSEVEIEPQQIEERGLMQRPIVDETQEEIMVDELEPEGEV